MEWILEGSYRKDGDGYVVEVPELDVHIGTHSYSLSFKLLKECYLDYTVKIEIFDKGVFRICHKCLTKMS